MDELTEGPTGREMAVHACALDQPCHADVLLRVANGDEA